MTVQPERAPTSETSPKEDIERLLQDPALLFKLKQELDRYIIGEDESKILLYLICASSFTKFNLSAIITGSSSSGKSWLKKNVLQYFGNVLSYTRVTGAAPDRLGKSLTGKILDIEELRGSEAAQPTLRIAISEGRLNLLSTTRDEEGHITTEEITTEGTPTFITTCTNPDIDDELLNRLFIISLDESQEQTKEIIRFEAKKYHRLGDVEDAEKPNMLFGAIINELLPITTVEIPFLEFLAAKFPLPQGRERACGPRRDFKKLVFLIGIVAWLHQKQRVTVERTGILDRCVVASPVDFQLVWNLCETGFLQTLYRLTKRHEEVLACFKAGIPITTGEVAAEIGFSENRARELLRGLVWRGYLSEDDSQKTHKYMLKQEKKLQGTIEEFVASLNGFEEKNLEEWLKHQNYKILFKPQSTPKAINPVTGEVLERLDSKRILLNLPITPEHGTIPQIELSDATKKRIEPFCNLCTEHHTAQKSQIKDTGWVDEPGVHFCCLCGTFSETSWRAILVDGRQLPLCETCREEFQSPKIMVDNRCERESPLSGSPQNGMKI